MLKRLNILLLILLLISCQHDPQFQVVETYPSGKPKIRVAIVSEKTGEIVEQYEELWETGGIKIKGVLRNGKRSGEWKSFYEKGNVWSIGYYADGVRNGQSLVYYPDGTLMMKGYYKNDLKDSTWVTFTDKGDTLQTALIREGKIIFLSNKENLAPVKNQQ